ncbi:MAG TPA: penicillin-binding protein [Bryobacteraceae bacterium]|nr:penicillin-binding protein [Bryobacteraceae bacterium]
MKRPPLTPLAKSTERLLIMGLILCGWAFIVVVRLLQLQVFGHDHYVRLGDSQQERLEPIEAPRGAILDRDGNYLAISSASQLAIVNPQRIPNKELASALLARILGTDATVLQSDLEAAAASRRHRGYFVVESSLTPQQADTLRALKLDWLEIRQGSIRTYPNGQLAAHVIGDVNAEGQGAAGVELKLNKDLRGTPGVKLVKMDVQQRPYASQVEKAAVMGKTVGLTINSQLQHVAEQALQAAVVENHADHGSLVAMDPKTGEVLALANYPTYDLSVKLHAGEKPHGREDLAVVAPYEPGSVFKVITLAAALETTRLRPDTIIPCAGGVMKIFGRTVHDAENHGDLSMADVLAMSSNVGAIRIGMEVGAKNLYDYVRRFGIGSRTGIELPAEAPGMLRRLSRWQPTSLPSVAFGHEVSVTTVQLARMGAVIANGGYLVHPHIVAWEQAPGEAKQYPKFNAPVRVLEPSTVGTMRQMMERVVTSPHGTAHHLHLVGYSLAGKTGTAQIFDFAHHAYTHKYNASFMGFSPINNPSVLIVVTVSGTTGTAGFGSTAAGPAFDSVATEALRLRGVRRDVPEEIEALEQKELAQKEKEKSRERGRGHDEADEDTVAGLATPLTPEEATAAMGSSELTARAEQNLSGPKVPNFVGKTVQSVMEEAAQNGIEIDMLGQGMARAQSPPAGAFIVPGEHILVRFAR